MSAYSKELGQHIWSCDSEGHRVTSVCVCAKTGLFVCVGVHVCVCVLHSSDQLFSSGIPAHLVACRGSLPRSKDEGDGGKETGEEKTDEIKESRGQKVMGLSS